MQVVHGNRVFAHERDGHTVVRDFVAPDPHGGALGDGSRGRKDQPRPRPLQAFDQGTPVLSVFGKGNLQLTSRGERRLALLVDVLEVVQSPVEVNDGPSLRAEPVVDLAQALDRGFAVHGWPVHVGDLVQQSADVQRVVDRDGIPDQQDLRETGPARDGLHRRMFDLVLHSRQSFGNRDQKRDWQKQQAGSHAGPFPPPLQGAFEWRC